ncbi:hypothetical protein [Paenibacillus sp. L3-i20]|uniref:hypothetical protein n=1 Tax=Paenibacillus sp. L3-i20 TaxID=2905833 RepID=UPI001EDD5705|nr:hypothetical protein [Paenibacillus sp. L3-i20]GKU78072.1 hypothetical protein L3i20_v224690 [Paenibacillus sp. L3-i20]
MKINGEGAGLHLELVVKVSCDAEQLIKLAASVGVRIYGSQDAAMDCADFPKIYLGFGNLIESELERGIQLLAEAWSDVFLAT